MTTKKTEQSKLKLKIYIREPFYSENSNAILCKGESDHLTLLNDVIYKGETPRQAVIRSMKKRGLELDQNTYYPKRLVRDPNDGNHTLFCLAGLSGSFEKLQYEIRKKLKLIPLSKILQRGKVLNNHDWELVKAVELEIERQNIDFFSTSWPKE